MVARTDVVPACAGRLLAALRRCSPGCAHAAYPERTITLIVPFPAGGPTDIIARIVSLAFQKSLGQSVIVENRSGGGGNPGMAIAARATPDGYTLLLTSTAIAVNQALYNNLPYDPLKDFVPICELVNAPNVLFVRSDPTSVGRRSDCARESRTGRVNHSSPGAARNRTARGHDMAILHAAAALQPWPCSRVPCRFGGARAGRATIKEGKLRRWRSPAPSGSRCRCADHD
jgi:tripartite-type tricarboxylate transporter receptor subunit TctC